MSVLRILKKFSAILSLHQKIRIIELIFMMIIGGLLETFSISLMLPFMNAVMNPEDTMNKWYARWICELLDLNSPRTFLIVVAVALAILYILKNVYLILEYNIQYRFVYRNMFAMQGRILKTYIYKPYEFFLNTSSSEIFRVVNSDTYNTFLLLLTLLNLFTEIIVSVMLITTIFVITPLITLCIGFVLGIMLLAIYIFVKPIMFKAGVDSQVAATGMHKWLMQSTQGIKELKVMRAESYFLNSFGTYGNKYVNNIRITQVLGLLPKYVIEAISMSTMFIVIAVLIYRGGNLEDMVPILSAVAMAAIRLLPSINRISSYLGAVAYNEPMLDKLIETLDDIGNNDEKADQNLTRKNSIVFLKNTIDFHKVTFHYPKTSQDVLNDACFTIYQGESIGLVGESGSGKTTVADIILGLLYPQEGAVLIDNQNIQNDLHGWYSQIGYIPQMIFMLDDTIRANVAFGISDAEISDAEIWRAIKEASMEEFVKSLPNGLDTEIGERGVRLSGGQRQRIGIARALYRNPAILIFDEATSALDNETESMIMESIHHLHGQKTMIIIAHRLSTIEACDHVYRVKDGKVIKER